MVVVTGGSGFLASHILKLLIKSGRYRIRATVRNAQDTKNAKIMDEIREAARLELEAERRAGQMPTVELVSADLEHSTDSDWDRAVSGARFVIHTASPITMDRVRDEEKYFVEPAKKGVLGVLKAAHRQGVERFILTSSMAAIVYGQSKERDSDHVFTENDWTIESNTRGYIKSKAVAERAAWEYWRSLSESQRNQFQLTAINPSYIQGPLIHSKSSASNDLLFRTLTGNLPLVPNAGLNVVDVRDVALAHVAALDAPAARVNGERFLLNACSPESHVFFPDVIETIRSHFEPKGFRISNRRAPFWLLRFVSFFDSHIDIVLDDIRNPKRVSGSKAAQTFGFRYIDWRESVKEMGESLIRFGIVQAPKHK